MLGVWQGSAITRQAHTKYGVAEAKACKAISGEISCGQLLLLWLATQFCIV